MYTDGAYEVHLPDGSMMSLEDLASELSKYQNKPSGEIHKLYHSLVELNDGHKLEDDFTIMKISINPHAG